MVVRGCPHERWWAMAAVCNVNEADAPNRCGSSDITKLRGPAKWTYYYL